MPKDEHVIGTAKIIRKENKKRKRLRNQTRAAQWRLENLLVQQASIANSSLVNIVPVAGAPCQGISKAGVTSETAQTQPNTSRKAGTTQPLNTTTGVAGVKQPPNKSQIANLAVPGTSSQSQTTATAKGAKPKGPANQTNNARKWVIPQYLIKWKLFQQNIQWFNSFSNYSGKRKNNKKPNNQKLFNNNNKPQVKTGDNSATNTDNKNKKNKAMAEIKWELNRVDDLDDSTEDSPVKSHNTPIIQGTASQIKLTVKDHRKLIATKSAPDTSNTAKPEVKSVQKLSSAIVYDFKYKSDNQINMQTQPPAASNFNRMPAGVPKSLNIASLVPAGVPKSFLMHQESFGAIQPQQNPIGKVPVNEPALCDSAPTQIPVQLNYTTFSNNSNVETKHPQKYSPTEVYDPIGADNDDDEGKESPDVLAGGQKRLSAFRRLGPVSQPKKPKLTINLLCNKDVREVVDDTKNEDQFTPVHLRQDILKSSDETVVKYLPWWPWKKNVPVKKSVTARSSKSVMLLEQEQMEEAYEKDGVFFQVCVRDFPATWKKEQVLDLLLDNIRGKSFIPCFIECTPQNCKFLVIRSKSALAAIHKLGFYIRQDDAQIGITISQTDLSLKQVEFIPRLVLRKILSKRYDSEMKLDLEAFTLQEDVSHFIYYPLNRHTNQSELTQLQSTVAWEYLTDLNLSHNRLKSVDGFNLESRCPRLKILDLSHNYLERVTLLLRCRELSLKSLRLEGNPLCHDYIDPDHYVKVVKMMFPSLKEIDGLPIHLKGDLPKIQRHHCPEDAKGLVEKFLEVFFPLLDSEEERGNVEDLYDEKAVMTVTYRYSSRSYLYRHFRNLTLRARSFEEGELEAVEGSTSIAKLISKWPLVEHDPFTFTSDVLHHNETSTIVRVGGVLKLTSDSLAQDEHLLAFTRTFVLTSRNGLEYKIQNEMVYWDEPTAQYADIAFQINSVRPKRLNLKFETPPDKETKKGLIDIFSKITELDKEISERCLEVKEWNLKNALEHFMKLVKLDCLDSLKKTDTHHD